MKVRSLAEELMQFFSYEHLPAHLQAASRPFCEAAKQVMTMSPETLARASNNLADGEASVLFSELMHTVDGGLLPCNSEATWACNKISSARDEAAFVGVSSPEFVHVSVLRKLLEAKDCAVRALVFK
jgi:hypothetical protein